MKRTHLTGILAAVVTAALLTEGCLLFSEESKGREPSVALPPVTVHTTEGLSGGRTLLEVPYLSQEGLLPTGCEVVSAAMLLRYYGIFTPVKTLAYRLPRQELAEKRGALAGPDPRQYFVGDPFSAKGYGCYAPVIAALLNQELERSSRRAEAVTGVSLDTLIHEQVAEGRPVLIWATIHRQESRKGQSWTLENGEIFTWVSPEHCLVLVGADADSYYFNDPYQNNGLIRYRRELVRKRYQELGMQAVVVA
ncbi:MAG: C39 family peptidase [Clostridiales bacterium]|nr:C39 family peptidase [Clostridiales bacterium]